MMPLSRYAGAEIGSVDLCGPVAKANRQIATEAMKERRPAACATVTS